MKLILAVLFAGLLPFTAQAASTFALSVKVTGPQNFASEQKMMIKDGAPYLTTITMPPVECKHVAPPAAGNYQFESVPDGLTMALQLMKDTPEGVDLMVDTESWLVTQLGAELEQDRCYTDTGARERKPIPSSTWHMQWDKPKSVTLLNGTVMTFTPSRTIALEDGSMMKMNPYSAKPEVTP
ncbi:hypothetical protein HNP46_000450 [Pseudomonas nitritireducens]|uniref:DUF4412 domain-containing protein n=1 Tax=Pseudomonas nitroreducens TaxID=46680 RepID=A0A7W7KG13_PSENT|nr:hypothetical protein [Pseudomonas nitritireducens]MBB4861639.1 hypothetical protein [Pseudomonas nitritireducens]